MKTESSLKAFREIYNRASASKNVAVLHSTYGLMVLSRSESWRNHHVWQAIFRIVLMDFADSDIDQVLERSWNYGPFYNKTDLNGMPILGDLHSEHYGTFGNEDGLTIEGGRRDFLGLTASDDGEIDFHFASDEGKPSLIFEEDILVALALAFSEEHFQWPAVDMPHHQVSTDLINLGCTIPSGEEPHLIDLEPRWLLNTSIGPTLHISDLLAGRLAWDTEEFSFSDDENSHQIKKILSQISRLKTPHPKRYFGRVVNVNLEEVNLAVGVKKIQGQYSTSVIPSQPKLRISGDYQFTEELTRRWSKENDIKYNHGHRCAILTQNMHIILTSLPIFDRLLQFMKMIYSLNELKKQGFMPSKDLHDLAVCKKLEFISRMPHEYTQIVFAQPFFPRNRIGC